VFERFYEDAERAFPAAPEKLRFNEALRQLLDRLAGDLINATRQRTLSAGVKSLEDVRACKVHLAGFGAEVDAERAQLKAFLHQNLYQSAALDPEKAGAEKIIRELFEFWLANPGDLPASYQEKASHEPLPRVVCDYIAGMTDNFISEQYNQYCR
jgi:dGTPase